MYMVWWLRNHRNLSIGRWSHMWLHQLKMGASARYDILRKWPLSHLDGKVIVVAANPTICHWAVLWLNSVLVNFGAFFVFAASIWFFRVNSYMMALRQPQSCKPAWNQTSALPFYYQHTLRTDVQPKQCDSVRVLTRKRSWK